eukprot:tig00021037_g17453.t1
MARLGPFLVALSVLEHARPDEDAPAPPPTFSGRCSFLAGERPLVFAAEGSNEPFAETNVEIVVADRSLLARFGPAGRERALHRINHQQVQRVQLRTDPGAPPCATLVFPEVSLRIACFEHVQHGEAVAEIKRAVEEMTTRLRGVPYERPAAPAECSAAARERRAGAADALRRGLLAFVAAQTGCPRDGQLSLGDRVGSLVRSFAELREASAACAGEAEAAGREAAGAGRELAAALAPPRGQQRARPSAPDHDALERASKRRRAALEAEVAAVRSGGCFPLW